MKDGAVSQDESKETEEKLLTILDDLESSLSEIEYEFRQECLVGSTDNME